ncbi:hypothetical protein HMPREF1548_03046 [Clostridium sp. KLE 1755]|nr:hypothetical protein HMPREF1548_03046 [Clostridium sp. KLE 1755]
MPLFLLKISKNLLTVLQKKGTMMLYSKRFNDFTYFCKSLARSMIYKNM